MLHLHCVQRSNRLYGEYKRNISQKGSLQGVDQHDVITRQTETP